MKPIKIFFDKKGNTLNVWFDEPEKESVSEEGLRFLITCH